VSARELSRVFPRLRLSRLSAAELQYTCTQGERGGGGSSREECERRWDWGGRVGARVRRSRRSCGRARERTRRRRRRRTGSWTPARGLQIPTPGHILDTLWTPYTCIVDFGPVSRLQDLGLLHADVDLPASLESWASLGHIPDCSIFFRLQCGLTVQDKRTTGLQISTPGHITSWTRVARERVLDSSETTGS